MNPHGLLRQILSLVRLPISPLSHVVRRCWFSVTRPRDVADFYASAFVHGKRDPERWDGRSRSPSGMTNKKSKGDAKAAGQSKSENGLSAGADGTALEDGLLEGAVGGEDVEVGGAAGGDFGEVGEA